MRSRRSFGRLAAVVFTGAIVFAGCADSGLTTVRRPVGPKPRRRPMVVATGAWSTRWMAALHRRMAPAEDPEFPVGTEVTLTADHMEGMEGATATISGAFDTTTYSVSFTPTDGGRPVTDHKWVVHEELENPGEAPLAEGTEVVITADHMAGMEGAEATIDRATEETVYMVDYEADGMMMTNHKWVVESEIEPA